MAGGQGQPFDIGTDQLCALVGLRQQPRIVVDQHRRLGQQSAVLDHGLPHARLGRHPGAGEFVCGTAIVVDRQQAGTAAPTARIEPDTDQAKGIEAHTQRALSKP